VGSPSSSRFQSRRVTPFTESVIREMTRHAVKHGAVNLAQGFPDFGAPEELKAAAQQAIAEEYNQYAITWGAKPLRDAIAAKYGRHYELAVDPEREITVVCGSTEGMIATLLAVADPGDEVVIFEPWYENYGPDAWLSGAERKFVPLRPPDWRFDPDELRAAFTKRTKAVILNSPNNPTGKVFAREELLQIAALCREYDALCLCDEIYEHIIYDGAQHVPMITLEGMRERTVLINSMSKTYSVTGWRVGWVIAPPEITASIRKVHDFLTVGAAAPLQQAGAAALAMDDEYYVKLGRAYQERRDFLMGVLEESGLTGIKPSGAYYVMCDIGGLGVGTDVEFSRRLVEQVGVAVVPGSSFFAESEIGNQFIRFCFCKKYETLKEAGRRLARWRER
jgi:aminotransferase